MTSNALTEGTASTISTAKAFETATEAILRLEKANTQYAQLILAFDGRIKALDTLLQTKLTVQAVQARAIANAVREKAQAMCQEAGADYKTAGHFARNAVWKDFKAYFCVVSHYDLPQAKYAAAMDYIACWASFAIKRRLRQQGN